MTIMATIREIIEWITGECYSCHDVVALAKKMKRRDFFEHVKGITITDTVNTALGALGLAL